MNGVGFAERRSLLDPGQQAIVLGGGGGGGIHGVERLPRVAVVLARPCVERC